MVGNNASTRYNKKLDRFQVVADRIVEQHEAVGISFGEEYWFSPEWDIPTLQKAKACYGAKDDKDWRSLIRLKTKRQNILLADDSESDSDDQQDSDSDAEKEDVDPNSVPEDSGEGTHEHISKPRPDIMEFDPLYSGDLLKQPEVWTKSESNLKSLFFNINGHGHKAGDPTKDKGGVEKALAIFRKIGADIMFLSDPRVTDSGAKYIRRLVEKMVPGARVIIYPTFCTPIAGASEDNSSHCMGGMIIIIAPEWAQLKTKTRVEKSGLSLIASVEFYTRGPTQGHKI
jgi:hypothetical protein